MKIGFTGTKHGMTQAQKQAFTTALPIAKPGDEFHHGMCTGADEQASAIAAVFGYTTVGYPGIDDAGHVNYCGHADRQLDPEPCLRRNHRLVDAVAQMYSTPRGEMVQRSGTWSTVRYTRRQGKPIAIFYPDGSSE